MNQSKQNNSLVSSLFRYLKKPDYNIETSNSGFLSKLADILKLWSLGIVVALIAGIFSAIIMARVGVDDSQNVLQDFFVDNSIVFIVLLVFFAGPIMEELTFRLALRYSPYRFGIFLGFAVFLLFELLMILNSNLTLWVDALVSRLGIFIFLVLTLFLILIIGLLSGFIISKTKISKNIEIFYQDNFSLIFYFSTLTFAFVHIFNFNNFKDLWLVLPFLVAPQLLLGFILAYVRMSYGINWSIFYHFFHNSIVSLPLLFISQISGDALDALLSGVEADIYNISSTDAFLALATVASSLFIFSLTIFSFYFLVRDYKRGKVNV